MAFIPVPNTLMVTLLYRSSDNTFAQNRFFCAVGSDPLETAMNDVAVLFNTWYAESGAQVVTANWSLVSITVRDMSEEEGAEIVDTTDLPDAGDNSGSANPFQVSYTVTWRTGLVGRSARGRTYGIGAPVEGTIHNVLGSSYHAAVVTAYNSLMTELAGAGHSLQVVSFIEEGVPRSEGRALPVTSFQVPFPLATQRRRLR